MDLQSILITIAVGAVAGLVADWLISGIRVGCLGAIIVGVLGGFIGGWSGRLGALGSDAPNRFLMAVHAFVSPNAIWSRK